MYLRAWVYDSGVCLQVALEPASIDEPGLGMEFLTYIQ